MTTLRETRKAREVLNCDLWSDGGVAQVMTGLGGTALLAQADKSHFAHPVLKREGSGWAIVRSFVLQVSDRAAEAVDCLGRN